MADSTRKSGKFVAPGDRLGVIEEFTPGPGTYTEQGTIYSEITGRTLMDMLNKKVSVFPLVRGVDVPRVGSTVFGQVSDVQSRSAILRITTVGKRPLSGFFTGILHISDVSPGFVESMFDVCKAGDIMRARVVSTKNRVFHLSTADKNLGIVYALCSRCGQILPLKGRSMRCTNCGKFERRKVAFDYGKGEI
ncbi:MAG: exosome complex RNA-binding protein Csl4 [Candidatus Bathyarchaeia archaeon]